MLLGQLRERRAAAGEVTAWLSLDSGDYDEARLISALSCAIRLTDTDQSMHLDLAQVESASDLVRALSAHLATHPAATLFLVIDGFENIAQSPAAAILARLAQSLLDRVHWTIAMRPNAANVFGRMRAQGLVRFIDDRDLRLNSREAATLIGRRLTQAEWSMTDNALGGWPVAVQALREAIASAGSFELALKSLNGASGIIGDYIASEVIAPLDPQLVEFLTDMSILPEIEASTADLVRERGDSHRLINEMECLGSFVDYRNGAARRLSPLLQTAFAARFEKRAGETGGVRRQAAAKLLASRKDYLGAVANLRLAGLPRDAVELIEQVGIVRLWIMFGLEYSLDVLAMLPPSLTAEYPTLRIGEALRYFSEGQMRSALAMIAQIRLEAEAMPPTQLGRLDIELAGVEVVMALSRDIVTEEQLEDFQRRSDAEPADMLSINVSFVTVVVYQQWGEFSRAEQLIPLCRQVAQSEYFLEIYLGWIAHARGQSELALSHYRHAADMEDGLRLRCLSEIMIAEALYTHGNFDKAAGQIDIWLPHLERSLAWFDFLAAAYCTQASVTFHRSGLAPAMAVIEHAQIVARERQSTALLRLLRPLKLSLLMRAGNWKSARAYEAAEEIVAACDALPENPCQSSWRERDMLRASVAEFHLRMGRLNEARECIEQLADDAVRGERATAKFTADLLLASLLWRRGARRRAVMLLGGIIEDAVDAGNLGPLVDRMHLIEPLLGPLHESGQVRSPAAKRWIGRAANDVKIHVAERSSQLTPREQEVLVLIRAGDRNKQIGRQLGISVNTVKFHMKQIAAKLGADGTGRAVLSRPRADVESDPQRARRLKANQWASETARGAISEDEISKPPAKIRAAVQARPIIAKEPPTSPAATKGPAASPSPKAPPPKIAKRPDPSSSARKARSLTTK